MNTSHKAEGNDSVIKKVIVHLNQDFTVLMTSLRAGSYFLCTNRIFTSDTNQRDFKNNCRFASW